MPRLGQFTARALHGIGQTYAPSTSSIAFTSFSSTSSNFFNIPAGDLVYNPVTNLYVGVASVGGKGRGTSVTSSDSKNWNGPYTIDNVNSWSYLSVTGIAVNPATGLYVTVAVASTDSNYATPAYSTSTDGVSWSSFKPIVNSLGDSNLSIRVVSIAVSSTGSYVVAGSYPSLYTDYPYVFTSSNGSTWQRPTLPNLTYGYPVSLVTTATISGTSYTVVIGKNGSQTGWARRSSDLVTWTSATVFSMNIGLVPTLYSVAWSPTLNIFAAVGHEANISAYRAISSYSTDGLVWTTGFMGSTATVAMMKSVIWDSAASQFVAFGGTYGVYSGGNFVGPQFAQYAISTDGINWTTPSSLTSVTSYNTQTYIQSMVSAPNSPRTYVGMGWAGGLGAPVYGAVAGNYIPR
jgi:hypothetical protein